MWKNYLSMRFPGRRFARQVWVAGVTLLAGTACAAASDYNFSTFATLGQSFENATLGPMTLSSQKGTLVYTNKYGGGLYDGASATNDITLTFSVPIKTLSITGGDGGGDPDAFGLLVYAFGTNNLLGSFYTPVFDGDDPLLYYTLTLSGLGDIGRVVFDPCNAGACPGTNAGSGGVVITDINLLSVGAVPEPSTWALMLIGFAGLGYFGLARRTKAWAA